MDNEEPKPMPVWGWALLPFVPVIVLIVMALAIPYLALSLIVGLTCDMFGWKIPACLDLIQTHVSD